jgi:hypothetical protein
MDPESSLPHSQEPATCPYPETNIWSEGLVFSDTANTANHDAGYLLRNVSGLSFDKHGITKPKIPSDETHGSIQGVILIIILNRPRDLHPKQ